MTETYRLMQLFRRLTGQVTRADGGVFAKLQRLGYPPSSIQDALHGLIAARDGHLQLPEGALPWLRPGEPIRAQLLLHRDYTSGRRVIDLAGDGWRGRAAAITVPLLTEGVL